MEDQLNASLSEIYSSRDEQVFVCSLRGLAGAFQA